MPTHDPKCPFLFRWHLFRAHNFAQMDLTLVFQRLSNFGGYFLETFRVTISNFLIFLRYITTIAMLHQPSMCETSQIQLCIASYGQLEIMISLKKITDDFFKHRKSMPICSSKFTNVKISDLMIIGGACHREISESPFN